MPVRSHFSLPARLCGPDYPAPVIARTQDERDLPVIAWRTVFGKHTEYLLPVVVNECHCGTRIPVERVDDTEVGCARIKGDSANGYELYHLACV